MSQSLKEALEESGHAAAARQQVELDSRAADEAKRARSAALQPYQRWWQNFRFTATQFEVKMFVKVQCEQWQEGLDFIAARNLNKLTTRCKTREEAVEQLRAKIFAWQKENVLQEAVEAPAGALIYWRIYD